MAARPCRKTFASLSLFLCVAPLARAQAPASISGVVLNAITGEPLPEAVISLVGTSVKTLTDEQGRYAIDSVVPGLIKVQAQGIGFHPITTDYYTALPQRNLDVDFKLAPVVVSLEGVDVTATRPGREYLFGSKVLTKDQLPPRGDILNALQGMVPGIRVSGRRDQTRVRARGSRNEVLYVIDGIVARPPLTFYIDAADVECVEVRRGSSAAQEFRRSVASEIYSGVILIWTKGGVVAKPPGCTPSP
jgi:hypothetical protein